MRRWALEIANVEVPVAVPIARTAEDSAEIEISPSNGAASYIYSRRMIIRPPDVRFMILFDWLSAPNGHSDIEMYIHRHPQ